MTDTKVVVDENKQLMKKPQKEDNDDEDAKQFIAKREQSLLDHPRLIALRDKVVFLLGVANVILLSYSFFSAQYILPYLYTVKAPLLIGYRLYSYGKHKWHLFCLDFCYFANTAVFVYLWAFPDNGTLFTVVFALSHGPLCFAVIAFRNSMVFHSIDKITSMFIHISPPVLMHAYVIRVAFMNNCFIWLISFSIRYAPEASSSQWYKPFNTCVGYLDGCEFKPDSISFAFTLFVPFAAFVGHSLIYYVIVQLILGKKVKKNREYLTSYRWLTRDKTGFMFKLVNIFGKKGRVLMFGLFNATYCFISLIPVYLWITNQAADLVFLALVIAVATWNGAAFYIEVFQFKAKD